jgi:hypothetical protein
MKQTGYGLWGAVAILGVFVICQQIQMVKFRTMVEQLRASNEAMLAGQKSAPVVTVGDATKKKLHCGEFSIVPDPERTNFYCIMGQAVNISGKRINRVQLVFAISRGGYESGVIYAVTENIAEDEVWKFKTGYIGDNRQPLPDVKLKDIQVFE